MNARLRACPEPGELGRLASQGANTQLQAHLAGCPSCTEDWRVQREMARLGPALPAAAPEPAQQRRLRADVLARLTGDAAAPLAPPPPPSWRWRPLLLAGAAGVAAATGLLLLIRPDVPLATPPAVAPLAATPGAAPAPIADRPALRPPATLRASVGARYTREAGPPHERVRLDEGQLIAEVTPARAGESFRVVTAHGEVEVRGTIFETVATRAGLQAVRVDRGKVVVRPEPGTEITLLAGEQWQRPAVPVAALAAPIVRRPPAERPPHQRRVDRPLDPSERHWRPAGDVPRPATGDGPALVWPDLDQPAHAAAAPGATAEAAFGAGLQLLRSGRAAAAADAFDRAAALAPRGPLAEDAWYWRAVALARAGSASGRTALAQFLARYPFSARRGEAAVMLGWLLLDHGDAAGAQRQFRVGLGDRSARVRGSAETGLARVAAGATTPR